MNKKSKTDNPSFFVKLQKDMSQNFSLYLLVLPVLVFYTLFAYKPMYGAIIAFKNFSPGLGVWGSPWVGFKHFKDFFAGIYFQRLMTNTLYLSFLSIIFGFPAPIILALSLNELRSEKFKRTVQTITYLPHFISIVVVCGMIVDFSLSDGLFNEIIAFFGGERSSLLQQTQAFRPIYIISDIWQGIGWGTIIYLAAITGIDSSLYEAAVVDGANRFKQMLHVTLPGITPTIIILLILRIGSLMNVGYEKTILLYNPSTYEVSDIISSYVYRIGLQQQNYSLSAAVGLFNSVINLVLVISTNAFSRRVSDSSLW